LEDKLLTVEEVAAILRVTRKAVYDLMRANRLPYKQIGLTRGRRISQSALNAFLSGADRGLGSEGESGYTKGKRRSPRATAPSMP
jgi:excisionase family DNA binding protein